MSYTTRVQGQFTIAPPLTWEEIKHSPFQHHHQASPGSVASWRCAGIDLELMVDMTETDVEGGVAFRYSGVRLVMQQIDEYRADTLVAQVQRVIDMFDDHHEYEGRLDAEGEGGGWGPDVWRLDIADRKAKKTSAIMMYPDELNDERIEYGAALLRGIADHVEQLPQDHELDPGRGEVREILRDRAGTLKGSLGQ